MVVDVFVEENEERAEEVEERPSGDDGDAFARNNAINWRVGAVCELRLRLRLRLRQRVGVGKLERLGSVGSVRR